MSGDGPRLPCGGEPAQPDAARSGGGWECPGCGHPLPQADLVLIAAHEGQCDYTDEAGQPLMVTLKWSVTTWHVAQVSAAELAAAAGGLPFAELTGRILDPDHGDPDEDLPALLDALAGPLAGDHWSDRWEISDAYDARRDQPGNAASA